MDMFFGMSSYIQMHICLRARAHMQPKYAHTRKHTRTRTPAHTTAIHVHSHVACYSILATNPNTLLGVWLSNAAAFATNANETALYEFNARNQLTLWGPTGQINDYAAKVWRPCFYNF